MILQLDQLAAAADDEFLLGDAGLPFGEDEEDSVDERVWAQALAVPVPVREPEPGPR